MSDSSRFVLAREILGARSRPGLVCPYDPAIMTTGAALATTGTLYAARVAIPTGGTLHDLAVYHGTASGNHRLGIYDTGDTSGGNRTLMYDSGSVALSGTNTWQVAGDPALTVHAGQQLDFVLEADNTTATFGRIAQVSSGQYSLPTNFLPADGGASPKLAWNFANGAYAAFPATVSEANCGTAAGVLPICIIARVT